MPPKKKIGRSDIVKTAIKIVRERGAEALNVRNIASALGCSTQPIYSNFKSIEAIRDSALECAEDCCREFYIEREIAAGKYPPYKASGMGYIKFATDERQLFKLLYMRDRSGEVIPEDSDLGNMMERMVTDNTGLADDSARLFHLEMWACVHGIATMIATGYLELDEPLISRMITDTYQGLKKRYEESK